MSYFPVVCFTVPCFRAQRPCVPVSAGIRITVFIYPEKSRRPYALLQAPSELPTELYILRHHMWFPTWRLFQKEQWWVADFLDMYFSENALWWTQRKIIKMVTKTKHDEKCIIHGNFPCTNVSYKGKRFLDDSNALHTYKNNSSCKTWFMKGILADKKWFFCDIPSKILTWTFIFQSVGSKQQGRLHNVLKQMYIDCTVNIRF